MNRADMLKRLKAGEDALELSIEKWQDIAAGKGKCLGDQNCALCESNINIKRGCSDCPVSKRTGESLCKNTPYWEHGTTDDKLRNKQIAQEEVEFLRSLRKGGSKTE